VNRKDYKVTIIKIKLVYIKIYIFITFYKFYATDVYDQNVLQLYSDYRTMSQMESYRTVMNFKLVTSDVPNASLAEAFIESLFRPETDEDLLRDSSYLDDGSGL